MRETIRFCLILIGAVAAIGPMAPPTRAEPSAPSLNCSRATSSVNRMICGSPALVAADRKLAADFQATSLQGGVDGKQLAAEEAQWLHAVRDRCATTPCLLAAYQQRDAAILDIGERAASPAAYADTRPFAASPAALSAARGLVGKPCNEALDGPGVRKINGFAIIVDSSGYVRPLSVAGQRFAFLTAQPAEAPSRCVVADVVTLPPANRGDVFLQCHMDDDSHGFAVRKASGETLAYWSIDPQNHRLSREPIHVLGVQGLKCQQPETGE